jgi:glutamate racemase
MNYTLPKAALTALHHAPIGIFDSGVGGLSILQHIRTILPEQHLLYFADSGFAPYGEKPEQVIVERAVEIADFLIAHGAKALVVACNTATSAAIRVLRELYPALLIVGVEPGLKPAAKRSLSRVVGVLATHGTLNGEKFVRLQNEVSASFDVKFLLQPCTGLAHQIEQGEQNSAATSNMLQAFVLPLLQQGADTLVLGCTHYPFVRHQIEQIIAQHSLVPVALIDTGAAIASQLQRLLHAQGMHFDLPHKSVPASLTGFTTGTAPALEQAFFQLLHLSPPVFAVPSLLK